MVELLIALGLAILLGRAWLVEAFLVTGGSMAPGLLGPHRHAACHACGFAFDFGFSPSDGPPAGNAVAFCPNCGQMQHGVGRLPEIGGDRLLALRGAFSFRPPRRWEAVVVRDVGGVDAAVAKRVVGLPGERIQIRGGNVYINDQIARKTLPQQRALAVPVHDDRFRPAPANGRPTRWQLERGPLVAGSGPEEWLVYHHWQRRPGSTSQTEESVVEDRYAYNQMRPIVDAHPVAELLLSCRIAVEGKGRLWLYASDGANQFVAVIEPVTGTITLRYNDSEVRQQALPPPLLANGSLVVMSLVDRQFLLAFDGQLVFDPYLLDDGESPPPGSPRPLAIGGEGLRFQLSDVRVFRDIYYTAPRSPAGRRGVDCPYQLAADEYFLLGDNSPVSEDSRYWQPNETARAALLTGKPLVVHLPRRSVAWHGWQFEIPDFARIRAVR